MVRWGFWKNRTHNLARMSIGDLVIAFFSYYAVLAYLGFAGVTLWLAARWFEAWPPLIGACIFTALMYPLALYLLHRWVLHGQYLYRSPLTAKVWKRMAQRYPWVAALSNGMRGDSNPRRFRAEQGEAPSPRVGR
jgi:hypothetical protein